MKKTFLSLFLLLATGQVWSQDESKVSIALAFGPSIPVGEYGAKSRAPHDYPGYAKSGALFDVRFAYKIHEHWGIAATLRGQAHPIDDQAWSGSAALLMAGGATTSVTTSGGYALGGLFFGPLYTTSISDRLSFDARIMSNLSTIASMPEVLVTANALSTSEYASSSRDAATSPAYFSGFMVGTGLQFALGGRGALLFSADYSTITHKFENVPVSTVYRSPAGMYTFSSSTTSGQRNFSMLNVALGVGLRF